MKRESDVNCDREEVVVVTTPRGRGSRGKVTGRGSEGNNCLRKRVLR